MMELRQWVAIRLQMAQNLAKNATIQSFWSQTSPHNPPLNRNRYQVIERHLNVESNQQMPYNNAPWFWKVEIALNVFRTRLFSFTISGSIDESANRISRSYEEQVSSYTQTSEGGLRSIRFGQ